MWTEFHFLRPWWLLALLPLAAFLTAFARQRFAMRRWQNVVDEALMPHVLIGTGDRSRRHITVLLAIAGLLLITALSGPVWQRIPQPVFRNLDALVIALDLSASMNVADIKPSRLTRARFKIRDILERRTDGQTALIAYAADAFIVSPLTDDTQTINALVPALTTALMPSQGSRADRALEKARQLLQQSGATSGQVLLITDGVQENRVAPVARDLAANGISVSVLGVGTDVGGPIPGPNGFITQNDGSIVIAKLGPAALNAVANAGDGQYRLMSTSDSDIDGLLAAMTDRPGTTEETGLETDTWREEGPWLLLPLLLLAPLAFRRGVLAAWLAAALLPLLLPVQPANAFSAADLWSRPDQRASRMLAEGEAEAAAEVFTDPAWKGAAAYKAGQYAESLATLDSLPDIEATYNRGNALAQLGRYDEAIAAYENVLERNPEHRDARYNLEQVKELLQQEQQQEQEQEQQQEQQANDNSSETGDNSKNEAGGASEDNQDSGDTDSRDGGSDSAANESAANNGGQSGKKEEPGQGQGQDGSNSTNDAGQSSGNEALANSAEQPPQDDSAAEDAQADDQANAEPADTADGRASIAETSPPDEDSQATEQWLRKIPDDPGGLLRRKFYYQYQRQPAEPPEEQPW